MAAEVDSQQCCIQSQIGAGNVTMTSQKLRAGVTVTKRVTVDALFISHASDNLERTDHR
jgi:hypothetical protein